MPAVALSQPETRVVSIYYFYHQYMSMVPLTIRKEAIYAILALYKRQKKKTLMKRTQQIAANEHR
ncbi:MAG TPA: hypothetical protein DDW33_13540 [Ktedonobacter sp.]|nr:hypothetical protein [Ktedonobacter sp.]HBE29682.1 hypothetical protein [Ktedonobacter sp.]